MQVPTSIKAIFLLALLTLPMRLQLAQRQSDLSFVDSLEELKELYMEEAHAEDGKGMDKNEKDIEKTLEEIIEEVEKEIEEKMEEAEEKQDAPDALDPDSRFNLTEWAREDDDEDSSPGKDEWNYLEEVLTEEKGTTPTQDKAAEKGNEKSEKNLEGALLSSDKKMASPPTNSVPDTSVISKNETEISAGVSEAPKNDTEVTLSDAKASEKDSPKDALGDRGLAEPPATSPEPESESEEDSDSDDSEDTLLTNADDYLYFYNKKGQKLSVKVKKSATDPTRPPTSGRIALNTTYNLTENSPVTYSIPDDLWDDEFYAVEVVGSGKIKVELLEDDSENAEFRKSETIPLVFEDLHSFVVIQGEPDFQKAKQTLRLTSLSVPGSTTYVQVTLYRTTALDLPFNMVVKLFSQFARQIRIKVFTSASGHPSSADRFQFLLETSLKEQPLLGDESASMRINFHNREFPTRDQYDLKPSANSGTGLLKTVSRGKPGYCDQTGGPCTYYVSIFVEDVEECLFNPSQIKNGDKIRFEEEMTWLEEVETNELVDYVFTPDVDAPPSLFFAFTPIDNYSECYLNVGSRPDSLADYQFRLMSGKREDAFVSAHTLKALGIKNSSVHVRFVGKKDGAPASMTLKVAAVTGDQLLLLKPYSTVNGLAMPRELNSFHMDFSAETEGLDVGFLSDFTESLGKLWLRECPEDDPECTVRKTDLENAAERHIKTSLTKKSNEQETVESIFRSFRCRGAPKGLDPSGKEFPVSKTCRFAIGVQPLNEDPDTPVHYTLNVSGGSSHTQLSSHRAANVKALAGTIFYYKLPLNQTADADQVVEVKLYGLTGRGSLFVSMVNPYPDAGNHQQRLFYEHDTASYLKTKTLELNFTVPLADLPEKEVVFLAFEAEIYSLFDLFVSSHSEDGNVAGEAVVLGQSLHRTLSPSNTFEDSEGRTIAYRDFRLDLKGNDTTPELSAVEVTLNSEEFSLAICVHPLTDDPKTEIQKPCLFSSPIGYLALKKTQLESIQGGKLLISIQKQVEKDSEARPISFTLTTAANANETVHALSLPGSSHKGYLSSDRKAIITIDLSPMERQGLVVFAAEDPEAVVEILSGGVEEAVSIGKLDDEKFGLLIPKASLFKAAFCATTCQLTLVVSTPSSLPGQYQVTYTIDDKPILVHPGLQYLMPNLVTTFYLCPASPTSSVAFDVYNHQTSVRALSKIVRQKDAEESKDLKSEISDIKFDLKSEIASAVQLVYSENEMRDAQDATLLFQVEPKSNYRTLPTEATLTFLTSEDMARVYIRSKTVRLSSYQQVSDSVNPGQLKYYLVELPREIDFSIASMNVVGTVQVLLGKGADDYPTADRFWKRQTTSSGDVIVVKTEEYQGSAGGSHTFVVGVLGVTQATYSVVLLTEFSKLFKLEFQKMFEVKLEPGHPFYVDFYDKKSTFESMFYAEGSDVEIALLDYDKRKGEDLITAINNDANYFKRLTFKDGSAPWTDLHRESTLQKTHLVLRLSSADKPAAVTMAMFDPRHSIIAPAEKRFHFAMDGKEEKVFKVLLDRDCQTADIDIKLFFGKVVVSVSDSPDVWAKQVVLVDTDQKYTTFDLSDAAGDIIVFQTVYLKVEAYKFSKFSILVKPKNGFKQLTAGEPEIVYAQPDADTFLYFEVTEAMRKVVQSIDFEINVVSYYNDQPEMLFMAYDSEGGKSDTMLPMRILDTEERNLEDMRQSVVSAFVREGFYIIKVKRSPNKTPTKVVVIVNKTRQIEENGLSRGVIPKDPRASEDYSLFLSETGEFRLVIESCVPLTLKDLTFDPKVSGNEANVEGNLKQSYPYILIDETGPTTSRDFQQISYPILRGLITGPGHLSFRVTQDSQESYSGLAEHQRSYVMMSEFRPQVKSLILKDYIDIFKDRQTFESFYVYYDFVHSQSSLRLTIRQPSFKIQLLDDYPSLEKVRLKLKVYLFSQANFTQRIEACGLSALEGIPKTEQVLTVELTREELLKGHKPDVEVFFSESEIESLGARDYLNVLCYISARFFENEEEEWQVAFNLKYTNVPYFFLTIKNKHISRRAFRTILMGVLALLVLMLILVCLFIKKKQARGRQEILGIRPVDIESSVIGMDSAVSIEDSDGILDSSDSR